LTTSTAVCFVALVSTLTIVSPAVDGAAPASAATVVPAQWIVRQYTELLGRAPTALEYKSWENAFTTNGCTRTSLRAETTSLAGSLAFNNQYAVTSSLDRVERLAALVRAVRQRDLQSTDVTTFTAYLHGTETWPNAIARAFATTTFTDAFVAQLCNALQPNSGFTYAAPLDLRSTASLPPSRTQVSLQATLNAATPGTVVQLNPGEVIRIGGTTNMEQPLRIPAGVTLTTTGGPTAASYARQARLVLASPTSRVCGGTNCTDDAIVDLARGASLRNVWVDASAATMGNVANVESHGSTPTSATSITDDRLTDPSPRGAAIRARGKSTESVPCDGEVIKSNVVTAYTSHHEVDRLGRDQAVDGIDVSCENASVQSNTVVDVSGMGVVLRGGYNRPMGAVVPQGSAATTNTVVNAGIAATSAYAAEPAGMCRSDADGLVVPCVDALDTRSFTGTGFNGNVYWTSPRASFDVALLVGAEPTLGVVAVAGDGARFTNNTSPYGSRANIGIAVAGMSHATVSGNSGTITLLDTNPASTWDTCPQAAFVASTSDAITLTSTAVPLVTDTAMACVVSPPAPGGGDFVKSDSTGTKFVGATTGQTFTPWGLPYGGDDFDQWLTDWPGFVQQFRGFRHVGVNTVRLLLQVPQFIKPPSPSFPNGTPDTAALAHLGDVVELARETGIHLDLNALGILTDFDSGSWYDNLDETHRWATEALWMSQVAAQIKGSPWVFALSLMSEPSSPAKPVTTWCRGNRDGRCYVQALTLDPLGRTALQTARSWQTKMNNAIRVTAANTTTLTSVGLFQYSGWRPPDVTDLESFGMWHIYPGATETVTQDIASAKLKKASTQPLVLEEVGNQSCSDDDFDTFMKAVRGPVAGYIGQFVGFYNDLAAQEAALDPNDPDHVHKQVSLNKETSLLQAWTALGEYFAV
jgi:hypothetical protein